MTRWLGWFVAWLSVIGLLWILDRQAGVSPHVGPSIDLWSNAGPTLSHVFLSRSPVFTRIRTDAFGSSAPHHACMTPGDGGPPWLDLRGPPGVCRRPWVSGTAAGHAGSADERPRSVSSRNSRPEGVHEKSWSFATAFS